MRLAVLVFGKFYLVKQMGLGSLTLLSCFVTHGSVIFFHMFPVLQDECLKVELEFIDLAFFPFLFKKSSPEDTFIDF